MKKLIHFLSGKLGYQIRKNDPFIDMQRLVSCCYDPIIFDVGAHHGCVTKTFRSLFPSASIYAFEPFPESFNVLQALTCSDPNIYALNLGLSDHNGLKVFHQNRNSATNSLLATDENAAKSWRAGILEDR